MDENEKELFILYGSAASEVIFDYPCYFFKKEQFIGVVPYRVATGCAVVFGDPLCPPHELQELTRAFHNFCKESNLRVIYMIVSKEFADFAKLEFCPLLMEVCEEFIYDPQDDPVLKSHRLKSRVLKAKKQGLTLHEYIPQDPNIESILKEVGILWQKSLKGPYVHLGHLNFFDEYVGKRWFYVKEAGDITAMMMLSRIDAKEGWIIKFFITKPGAFHDTSEFLMTSVLNVLKSEGCRFVTKGMMPLSSIDHIEGFGPFSAKAVRALFKGLAWFFKFGKRKSYWLRYHPKIEPAYLLFSSDHLSLNELSALLKVLHATRNS